MSQLVALYYLKYAFGPNILKKIIPKINEIIFGIMSIAYIQFFLRPGLGPARRLTFLLLPAKNTLPTKAPEKVNVTRLNIPSACSLSPAMTKPRVSAIIIIDSAEIMAVMTALFFLVRIALAPAASAVKKLAAELMYARPASLHWVSWAVNAAIGRRMRAEINHISIASGKKRISRA